MIRRLMVAPLLAALVVAAPAVTLAAYYDQEQEIRMERSTLEDIQNTLHGSGGTYGFGWTGPMSRSFSRPGILGDGRPINVRFDDVLLSRHDAPRLGAIVQDAAANLPPESRIEIQGRMDWQPFEVTIRSNRWGRKWARLEGLVFRDRYEAIDLLDGLSRRGVQHARLDARIGYQHVVGRIDNGMTRFEG